MFGVAYAKGNSAESDVIRMVLAVERTEDFLVCVTRRLEHVPKHHSESLRLVREGNFANMLQCLYDAFMVGRQDRM